MTADDITCPRNPIQSESESRIQNPNPIHVCVTRARENRRADAPPQGRDRVPGGPGVRAADAGTVPGQGCDAGTLNHEGLSPHQPAGLKI